MPDFQNLKDRLEDAYASHGFGVEFRSENKDSWSLALDAASYAPFHLTHSASDYYLTYFQETGEALELSHLISDKEGPIALWPMILVANPDGEITLKAGGASLGFPTLARERPAKAMKRLIAACYSALEILCKQQRIKSLAITSVFNGAAGVGIDPWHACWLEKGAIPSVTYALYGDLSLSVAEYRTRLRKSYKSLINKGLATWTIEILKDGKSPDIWQAFHELHLSQAGRATRSATTWALQEKAIEQGEAILVHSRDEAGAMAGGAYFSMSRDEAYYAVGAYDRALFDQPIAHALQFTAIQELMKRKIRWYRLGELSFSGQTPPPNKKELDIAMFKSGFSTHKILEARLRMPIKLDHDS